MKDTIRVLVVDDSPTVREILVLMLQDTPGMQVIGQARDGEEAVRLAARLRPDVITMDIRMPRMNGLEAIRHIMSTTPTPIVVVATSIYEADLNIAFNAIAAGALTVVEKPKGFSPEEFNAVRDQLVTTVRLMADVQVVTLRIKDQLPAAAPPAPPLGKPRPESSAELIAIGASTGGPGVLRQILSALPPDISIPITVVQHITAGFGQGFAHWLDSTTAIEVKIAQEGERVAAGKALVAPDDGHMAITPGGVIRIERSEPIKGQRPSATRMFESVAASYGRSAVGVILTGMGDDGADGLEKLHEAGAQVLAQDEGSCVVFGMPKVAIERGVVNQVLTPDEIAAALVRMDEFHKAAQGTRKR
ncbi:MAG: chemotaxis-specific protein-glutamate methyltransferase CheB [Thermoflexales bacterium]|nr:chemotaxis-specific protein-glutamate methyltransferase CheB [Thermoflexales bacterium]